MNIIDGNKISQSILSELKSEIQEKNLKPCLGVVLAGDDEASKIYVKQKEEAARKIGIDIKKHILDRNASEKQILEAVNSLNSDIQVNGILVQLPLPSDIPSDNIIQSIDVRKDVDGFLPKSDFDSPFVLAIKRAIDETGGIRDKNAVSLVNSDIFGQALKQKLNIKYRVWVVNELDDLTEFDLIITALGQPQVIKDNMIKPGVVLIDGGISRENGKILGDVDKNSVINKASWLSPVPGGVGPITIAYLLKNVVSAYGI